VKGIESYMSMASSLQIDLSDGYLFRTTSKDGLITSGSVSSEALNRRLKIYLDELGISEGETAHSFRSGCAISLALTGSHLADIIEHVGWEREHTANYYMQLAKVLRNDRVSAQLAEALQDNSTTEERTTRYREMNSLKDFALAFPPAQG
jgi:integrase